jgi:hypothetical protein
VSTPDFQLRCGAAATIVATPRTQANIPKDFRCISFPPSFRRIGRAPSYTAHRASNGLREHGANSRRTSQRKQTPNVRLRDYRTLQRFTIRRRLRCQSAQGQTHAETPQPVQLCVGSRLQSQRRNVCFSGSESEVQIRGGGARGRIRRSKMKTGAIRTELSMAVII